MFREVNRVTYDPNLITQETMISALKSAGTFRGVASIKEVE
jgi:DNA-directed RNA polymerase specialized sigma24 family protein